MRLVRDGATLTASYSLSDPEGAGGADWVTLAPTADIDTIMPAAAGPRYVGVYGGNGSITASYDYLRFSPDEAECEEDAPVTTATLDPAMPGPGGTYGSAVNVNLSATEAARPASTSPSTASTAASGRRRTTTAAPIRSTPRSPSPTTACTPSSTGRPTNAANVEEIKSVGFTIRLPECERSDEFDGTALGARWLRHTRNSGTPTTGALAPRLDGGQLIMPTNDFELDGNNVTTATGPVNFVGQDLPALGDDWQVETQFTIQHTGGWQHAGLIVWQSRQQLLPLDDHDQPHRRSDLRRAVEGQPDLR